MRGEIIYFWKTVPFLRLLIPMVAGICIQWHFNLPIDIIDTALFAFIIALLLFYFLPLPQRFQFFALAGITIAALFACLGARLTYHKNARNEPEWIGKQAPDTVLLVAKIEEEPVPKRSRRKSPSV